MPKHAFFLFRYSRHTPKPLAASFSDGSGTRTYPLFVPGSGISLKTVLDNISAIKNEFAGDPVPAVIINDFKSVLDALDPPPADAYNAYDYGIIKTDEKDVTEQQARELCEARVKAEIKPAAWMRLLGKASVVYHAMQKRGIMNGYAHTYPRYELNTVSGRSKTLDFNLQGADATYDIHHPSESQKYLIHVDWISADLRAAQLLSGDEFLAEAFRKSDPYTVMAKGELTRADCKGMMIRALYEMDLKNPALQFYPTLHKWVTKERSELEAGKTFSRSLLGREFRLAQEGDPLHNMRSVFNASLQGTVVHAMHNALWQIHQTLPGCILAETHDSLTLAADRHMINEIVKMGTDAMLHPFRGIVGDDPTFPVRVYVGKHWKRWKLYREVR